MGMADRIKERRLALGYTQEELAEKVGLQKSAIAKYENGRVENMKRSMIAKMSEALETTPAYLMGWEKDVVWYKSSAGIIDVEDELKGLLSRIESSHTVMYGNADMDDTEKAMLMNSLKGVVQNMELIMQK